MRHPPFAPEAACPTRPRLSWSSSRSSGRNQWPKVILAVKFRLTGWSSPPNQRPPASPQPPPPGQQAVTIGEPWQRRRPIPTRSSGLINSLYKLLAIYQFLSNRCLIATSFPARLVRLQFRVRARAQIWAGAVVSQLPKLLGAGMHRITSSWTATSKTAVGLLLSAPLNFQAKSPEQAFRIGVWCRDFSAYRTLNTRTEHNNRRSRSRNARV